MSGIKDGRTFFCECKRKEVTVKTLSNGTEFCPECIHCVSNCPNCSFIQAYLHLDANCLDYDFFY